jgi:hypothetical protein
LLLKGLKKPDGSGPRGKIISIFLVAWFIVNSHLQIQIRPILILLALVLFAVLLPNPANAQALNFASVTPTPAKQPTVPPPERMLFGARYSFPRQTYRLDLINGSTQTLFLSTFTLPDAPAREPVETRLAGMRYGRTLLFPDAVFGTVYVLRDAAGMVMFVYAVTADPLQVVRVTNLSLVAARASEPVKDLAGLLSLWSGAGKNVSLHFVNASASPLSVSWVDFAGNEVQKALLEKDGAVRFDAFYGNAWAIRTSSGVPVMAYFVTEADNQVVTLTDEILSSVTSPAP